MHLEICTIKTEVLYLDTDFCGALLTVMITFSYKLE